MINDEFARPTKRRRLAILHALLHGGALSVDQLCLRASAYLGETVTLSQVGQLVRRLEDDDLVLREDDMVHLIDADAARRLLEQAAELAARQGGDQPAQAQIVASEVAHASIAPYYAQRTPMRLSIERVARVVDDVHEARLTFANHATLALPWVHNAFLRICVDNDVPNWSPGQTVYRNVVAISIVEKSGKIHTLNLNEGDVVTVYYDTRTDQW